MITVTHVAAYVLLVALVLCVIADAAGWHRPATGPGAVAAFVALTGCLLRLRLKGGRK